MELTAIINALKILKKSCLVEWFCDSKYCINMIDLGWLSSWEKMGWKRSSGEIQNLGLVKELYSLSKKHTIQCNWIKGHNGNELNEKCDMLANYAREHSLNSKLL